MEKNVLKKYIVLLFMLIGIVSLISFLGHTYMHSFATTKKNAYSAMKRFLNGKCKKLTNDEIKWWADNGEYKTGILFKFNDSRLNKHDLKIIAYNNYWISYFKKRKMSNSLIVNPNYIKAVINNESSMGTDTSGNGIKDVMQMFNPYDPDVHILARNKKAYNYYIKDGYYNPLEGISFGIRKKGYGCIKNLYKNNRVLEERVNKDMSICFGILWLYYKIQIKNSIRDGIIAYNGGGDDMYIEKIKNLLLKYGKDRLVTGNGW